MNQIVLLILMVVMAFMTYKNISLIKRNKNMKRYFTCTNAILDNVDNKEEIVTNFIFNEQDVEVKNKARVIKVICDLDANINPMDNLSFIDLDEVILTKGVFDKRKFEYNSDTFYWLVTALIKAHLKSEKEVIEALKKLVNKCEDPLYVNDVVIRLFNEADKTMTNTGDKGIGFYRNLLIGEYGEYSYDKRMIGFYKSVAATLLAYTGEAIVDEDRVILNSFADMKAGRLLLKALDLYETYKVVEDVEDVNAEVTDEEEVIDVKPKLIKDDDILNEDLNNETSKDDNLENEEEN